MVRQQLPSLLFDGFLYTTGGYAGWLNKLFFLNMLYFVLFLSFFKRQIHVDTILTTPKARHVPLHIIF
jgi:hypothetical protein